jgi:hypothetical protein
MSNSWEDWENEDFDNPVLNVPTQEQLKRLEEQKLIEDFEIDLAKDLVCNNKQEKEEDLALEELKNLEQMKKNKQFLQNTKLPNKKNISQKKTDKQKENEEKQRAESKKLKEDKVKKLKEREIFGEAEPDDEYDEYEKYEDMFY